MDRIFATLFEILTVVGALIGALFIGMALTPTASAPQGAEMAAIGIGFAVIPYCIAGVLHRGTMRRMARERSL